MLTPPRGDWSLGREFGDRLETDSLETVWRQRKPRRYTGRKEKDGSQLSRLWRAGVAGGTGNSGSPSPHRAWHFEEEVGKGYDHCTDL